jgi:hypothetical protein
MMEHGLQPMRAGASLMNDSTGSTGNPVTKTKRPVASTCHFCGGMSLRRSRFRPSDFSWLLILHWPVRCRRCSKRQFVFWTSARRIMASKAPNAPEAHTQDTWQTFTMEESPALRNDSNGTTGEGKR